MLESVASAPIPVFTIPLEYFRSLLDVNRINFFTLIAKWLR
jgi:hypothetical protein